MTSLDDRARLRAIAQNTGSMSPRSADCHVVRRPSALTIALLAVASALLCACGSADGLSGGAPATGSGTVVDSGAAERTMSVDGLYLVIGSDTAAGGLESLTEAALSIRDGCAVFTSELSGTSFAAIWPLGTTSDGTDVILPDGRRVTDGDLVRMAGGFVDPSGFERVAQSATLTPEALGCGPPGGMWLVNTKLQWIEILS